jgi:hypothetical protein
MIKNWVVGDVGFTKYADARKAALEGKFSIIVGPDNPILKPGDVHITWRELSSEYSRRRMGVL